MGSLVITFEETKECFYRVSVSEEKSSKGHKRPHSEVEIPSVRISAFHKLTPVAVEMQMVPITKDTTKKAAYPKPWVSKYAQNPFGVHFKDAKDPNCETPTPNFRDLCLLICGLVF